MLRSVMMLCVVAAVCATSAESWAAVLKEVTFASDSPAATKPGDAALMVDLSKASSVRVATIDNPGIKTPEYTVVGEVKDEDVKGEAYLEMWSIFPDGGRYFTRTLSDRGPMGKLNGTSDWRRFELPFISKDGYFPTRLEVNVVGSGGGKVWLRNGKLMEGARLASATDPNAWWGDRQGGLMGGILGASLGLIGAMIGVLSGRGRARNAVMAMLGTTIIMGVMLLIVGLVALLMGQGWAVYYPLLLCGVIATTVAGGMLPGIKRKYAEIEMRRLGAMDVV